MSEAKKQDTNAKASRWCVVLWEHNGDYKWYDQEKDPKLKAYGFQDEICPTTGRKHRQMWVSTQQVRFNYMKYNIMRGTTGRIEGIPVGAKGPNGGDRWAGLQAYCKKEETRDPEGVVVENVINPNQSLSVHEALTLLAKNIYWQEDDKSVAAVETQTTKAEQKYQREAYWRAVSRILLSKPHLAGTYGQPNMEKLWVKTFKAWKQLYINQLSCLADQPA